MLEPSVWYRATHYSDAPNFEPRPQSEATKVNRYNQIGEFAWYLGSDEKTAAVEVLRKPMSGAPVCIAPTRLLEPLVVLDLRSVIWGEDPIRQWILRNVVDKRFISQPTSDVEDTRPEYRVPQFVADFGLLLVICGSCTTVRGHRRTTTQKQWDIIWSSSILSLLM